MAFLEPNWDFYAINTQRTELSKSELESFATIFCMAIHSENQAVESSTFRQEDVVVNKLAINPTETSAS